MPKGSHLLRRIRSLLCAVTIAVVSLALIQPAAAVIHGQSLPQATANRVKAPARANAAKTSSMGRVRRPARGPVVDVAAAPIVLTGVSTDSRSFARGGAIFTDTTVEVETVERGHVSSSVVIRSAGGTLPSGLTQHTEHQPVLDPGVRSRLLLRPTTGGVYVVVGDAQGQIIVGVDQTAIATTCPDGDTPGEGWCWRIDNFGNNPRWARSAMPVKYRTNANTSDVAGEEIAVRAGFATWEDDPGSSMDWQHVGSTNVTAVANDGVNAVFWSSNASNFVAFATFWTNSRGKILGFDVEYNDNYSFSIGAEEGSPDVQTVALHEAGHAIGLGHVDDPNQVMYPFISDGTNRRLGRGDLNGVRAIYPARPR